MILAFVCVLVVLLVVVFVVQRTTYGRIVAGAGVVAGLIMLLMVLHVF